jgi:hypothetical protein
LYVLRVVPGDELREVFRTLAARLRLNPQLQQKV